MYAQSAIYYRQGGSASRMHSRRNELSIEQFSSDAYTRVLTNMLRKNDAGLPEIQWSSCVPATNSVEWDKRTLPRRKAE